MTAMLVSARRHCGYLERLANAALQGRRGLGLVRLALAALLVAVEAITVQPAAAGIVNVQSALAVEVEEGLSGSVTGALDWRTGNTARLRVSLAPVARYRTGNHLLIGYGSGEYELDNDDFRRIFGHARYRYGVTPRIIGEVFTQAEYDRARGLQLRVLAGTGPVFQLLDQEIIRFTLGFSYMFEYEQVADGYLVASGGTDDPQHRVSSYLTGSVELNDIVQLVETVYAQPRITDPNDIRLLNESQLVIAVSQNISFNTSFTLAYDTRPPTPDPNYPDPETPEPLTPIERLDTVLQSSITIQF